MKLEKSLFQNIYWKYSVMYMQHSSVQSILMKSMSKYGRLWFWQIKSGWKNIVIAVIIFEWRCRNKPSNKYGLISILGAVVKKPNCSLFESSCIKYKIVAKTMNYSTVFYKNEIKNITDHGFYLQDSLLGLVQHSMSFVADLKFAVESIFFIDVHYE